MVFGTQILEPQTRINTVSAEVRGVIAHMEPNGDQLVQMDDGRTIWLRGIIERVPAGLIGNRVTLRCTQLKKGEVWVGYRDNQ